MTRSGCSQTRTQGAPCALHTSDRGRRLRTPWAVISVVPASNGYLAGADHFDQAVRADHPLKGLDLVGGAGDLDRHRAPRHVDDFRPEDLRGLDDPGPAP